MSESLKDLAQKYKATALQKLDEGLQHLRLLQRLLESQASKFLETRLVFQGEVKLVISQIKLQKSHIIAANHSNKGFEGSITSDLKNHLDEDFLEGFIQVVEKSMIIVRERANDKEFRGRLFVLGKSQYRPSFYRLDYTIIYEKVEHPSLKQNVPELFALAYTLSSIKREVFTPDDISSFINDGFEILSFLPSHEKKPTVQSLIEKVTAVTQVSLKRKTFLHKGLEKAHLTYIKQEQATLKLLEGLQNFKYIDLALIHTKWENDFEYFGTGFFYNQKLVLTSIKNVTQRNGHQVKSIQVCLNPKQKIEWISVDVKNQVSSVEQLGLIRLPQDQNAKKRPVLHINGSAQLPQHVNGIYVYGYQFERSKEDEILIKPQLNVSPIKNKPSFDSYFDVKSRVSIGSLVFYTSKYQSVFLGVYNPLSVGVFNFDLIYGDDISQRIQSWLDRVKIDNQSIIGSDNRTQVPRSLLVNSPYSAIGLIYAICNNYNRWGKFIGSSAGQGTGTFITPNLIITCGHNILGPINEGGISGGTYIATQIRFYPAFSSPTNYSDLGPIINNRSNFYYSIKSSDFYVHDSYKNGYASNADLAVIHLKAKKHNSFLGVRSIPKSNKPFWANTNLTICGYPGQSYGKLRQHSGKGLVDDYEISKIQGQGVTPDMLYYQIDTTGGNSGSAVIYKNQQNKFEVVAIHTQGLSNNSTGAGIINSGPLLVGSNFNFVEEKLNTLNNEKKSVTESLQQYERRRFARL